MKSLISSENKKLGFTLVELIVVMAIATIMMTVLVVQQSSWSDSLAVSTQAYEMTLMIRQAQIYSLGVREYTPDTGSKIFDIGYGVYIDIGSPGSYSFFADKIKNGMEDPGEAINTEAKTFTKGVAINKICGVNINNGDTRCYPVNGIRGVTISFYRPDPKAIIKFINPSGGEETSIGPPTSIYLKSPGNKCFYVKIEANGQISTMSADTSNCI